MSAAPVPDYLTHYYEAVRGPFVNLSDLSEPAAETVLEQIRKEGGTFASVRAADYLSIRRELEERVRTAFIARGGQPRRMRPHYLILGSCDWLLSWYRQGRELRIPLAELAADVVSFTYGDTFPAMRYPDGKAHRGQVYTLQELPELVQRFGLPQVTNPDGSSGPDRYIEAQVWVDLTPYANQDMPPE
jgi:hypothetical protein